MERKDKESDHEYAERKIALKILKNLGISVEDKYEQVLNEKDKKLFEKISSIVESYVVDNINHFDLNKPEIEGESKKIYPWKNIALIELKPTMYSFTYNRYGVVEGTDVIRLRFWKQFAKSINSYLTDSIFGKNKNKYTEYVSGLFDKKFLSIDYPFASNFLGNIFLGKRSFAIVKFEKSLPPIEVVWKKYFLGTMKHNLKGVDKYPTLYGEAIKYEEKFPKDFIRFDWRNPLPDKDECIPEEFADFYINTESAKKVARLVSWIIDDILNKKGYELADLCYFMNSKGNAICSEITPDGMRIKKKGESYDKDLWRQGKDKDCIIKTWNLLLDDLVREEI